MPKMAATTPIRPVAPEMYTPLAELLALEEALLPLPELVPGERVPVPPGLDSPPEQVYVPLITLLLPERGWKWLQELEMSLVDWRLKAPRISEIAGRDTLLYVSCDDWSQVLERAYLLKLPLKSKAPPTVLRAPNPSTDWSAVLFAT